MSQAGRRGVGRADPRPAPMTDPFCMPRMVSLTPRIIDGIASHEANRNRSGSASHSCRYVQHFRRSRGSILLRMRCQFQQEMIENNAQQQRALRLRKKYSWCTPPYTTAVRCAHKFEESAIGTACRATPLNTMPCRTAVSRTRYVPW